MNTYNENLRTSIVNTLDEQKTALQKTRGELSAQEISLYYAQGALISANDKFDDTLQMYEDQQDIMSSINENNNTAINVIDAATQEKACVDKVVNNAAVAAANVQVAARAIVSLAGDIGNVCSIVNAADYQTQIYDETLQAKKNMDVTAYNAELASQFAMESTMLVSSITATTVLSEAQSTGAALTTLNDSYKTQFEKTSTALDTENAAVVTANNLEKKAEGVTEDLSAANYGMRTAYELNNLELNSGLKVLKGEDVNNVPFQTDNSFTFEFFPYLTPLYTDNNGNLLPAVEEYYVLIVDNASKATFSTASAETAISGDSISGKNMFIKVDPSSNGNPESHYVEMVKIANVAASNRKDIELGKEYCLFLYVKMTEAYKKTINNFEDVLSVGSENFKITKELRAATFAATAIPDALSVGGTLGFSLTQSEEFDMEYRVMFLPATPDKVGNLLSNANIPSFKDQLKLERLKQSYKNAVTNATNSITKLEANSKAALEAIDKDIAAVKAKKKYIEGNTEVRNNLLKVLDDNRTNEIKTAAGKIASKQSIINENQTKINDFPKSKVDTYQFLGKKGVFFNLDLAEQVPTGLFTLALNKVKLGNTVATPPKDSVSGTFELTLDENTTDNYGNKLNLNDDYTPVVLSYSTAEASIAAQFTNSLSDFEKTKSFKFS